MIGTTLTHYRLTAKLGEGGMGEVYRATDTKLGREVAIKVLPREFNESREGVARFDREAKVLASLDHPNIAAIYGLDQTGDTRFLVLQLIEGETLAQRLQRGPMPVRTALDVCRQITEALAAAHDKGVIHRDLKPANVKVTPEGKVKVLDFGIAKALLDEPTRDTKTVSVEDPTQLAESTRPGAILGTPAYMSPEQARGEPVDQRSDIWSFGCVLYECLTGIKLFGARTPIDSLHAVLHREPDWSAVPAQTPMRIQALLRNCLTRDSSQRLETIRDATEELQAALADSNAPAQQRGRGDQEGIEPPFRAKPRSTTLRLAAVLTGTLILAAVFWWTYHRAGTPTETNTSAKNRLTQSGSSNAAEKGVAVLPFVNLSPDKADEFWCDALAEEIQNALTKVKSLRVPAWLSVLTFKNKTETPGRIGEQLKVGHLLRGTVRKAGRTLRISVQLINVADGFNQWSETYDREMRVEDILQVQSDVAQHVAAELKVQIGVEDRQQLARKPTDSLEAYSLFLQGRQHWSSFTREGFEKALEYNRRAVAIDPKCAPAQAWLGSIYIAVANNEYIPPRIGREKAREGIDKAAQIEETGEVVLADAALKLLFEWDWEGARKGFDRALQLRSNDGLAAQLYSFFLNSQRDFTNAMRMAQRAVEMEPMIPVVNVSVPRVLYYSGRYEESVRSFQESVGRFPRFPMAVFGLGCAYLQNGQTNQAIEVFERAVQAQRIPRYLGGLGAALAKAGRRTEAEKLAQELRDLRQRWSQSEDAYLSPVHLATIYAALGDKPQALEWLQAGFNEHAPFIWMLDVDPAFESLRNEEAFRDLVRKMKLPQRD